MYKVINEFCFTSLRVYLWMLLYIIILEVILLEYVEYVSYLQKKDIKIFFL